MAGICTQGIDTGFVALGYTKVAALGGPAGNKRAPADLIHRAHAPGAGLSGLAGPRIGILRRHAACGARRRRELFLAGCSGAHIEFDWRHGARAI